MPTRYIGIGKETTYGEDVALTQFISALDESFALDNQIMSELEMGQRGSPKPMMGAFKAGGGFKFYCEPENIGLILLALFGAGSCSTSVDDPAAGEQVHTFTIKDAPQYLTVAVGPDVTAGQKTFPGFAIKKVKFTAAPNAKLLVEVEGFAKTINLDALVVPSFSVLDPFAFYQADAQIATVSDTDIQNFVIEIESFWKEDEFTLGDRTLRRATLQGIKISGTVDKLFEDLDEMEHFLGAAAATDPKDTVSKQALDLDFDTLVVISTVGTYKLEINAKECLWKTHKANISKQDRTIENLEFEAFYPTTGEQLSILLYNAVVSY